MGHLIKKPLAALVAAFFMAAAVWAVEPGQPVGQVQAKDENGTQRSLDDHKGKVVVLVFWGSDCPASKRYAERLVRLARQWGPDKVVFLGVASNGSDSADKVKAGKQEQHLSFPILLDKGGAIAGKLGVGATPTACVIDGQGTLRYRGQIDDDPQGGKGDRAEQHLRDAVQAVAGGGNPPKAQTPQTGTRIKP